eukprot:1451783-Pyramimonas_sp.AAC.1
MPASAAGNSTHQADSKSAPRSALIPSTPRPSNFSARSNLPGKRGKVNDFGSRKVRASHQFI